MSNHGDNDHEVHGCRIDEANPSEDNVKNVADSQESNRTSPKDPILEDDLLDRGGRDEAEALADAVAQAEAQQVGVQVEQVVPQNGLNAVVGPLGGGIFHRNERAHQG